MSAMCQRSAERINQVINKFLERYKLLDFAPGWEIRESPTGGLGIFATKDFNVGEEIFKDYPVIIGPRCTLDGPKICTTCLRRANLISCTKGCGLEICSESCQNSLVHIKECKTIRQLRSQPTEISRTHRKILFENLTPLRSLFLDMDDREVVSCLIAHDRDDHGHEIETLKNKLAFEFKEDDERFMKFVCCVMDANAFEVTLGQETSKSSVRGLYPLGSLANHSCVPNTMHVFNDHQEMVVRASVFIPKDTEIVHCYTRLIWGSTTRLYHLHRTKHFVCKCARCKDPTEFGTYIGSILCKMCRGAVSPVNPYKSFARWECQDCKKQILGRDNVEMASLLASVLRNIEPNDFPFMYKFLTGKLKTVVPENNQVAVELKCKIIWALGHKEGYKWNELTLEHLKIKEDICIGLITLLEKLRCAFSNIGGHLLYELFCCKRELINRSNGSKQLLIPNEIYEIMNKAACIMRDDVTAPEEVKIFNNSLVNMKIDT